MVKTTKYRSCTLYRHFDAAGVLLYVGVAVNPARRTEDHSKSAFWFREIRTITLEHFSSEFAAEEAERQAIQRERPKYNIKRWNGAHWVAPFWEGQQWDEEEHRWVSLWRHLEEHKEKSKKKYRPGPISAGFRR